MKSLPSLPTRIRSFLAREPDPDPQYFASFIGEARILLRQAVDEIENLRRLAAPVWPEECDKSET